MTASLRAVLAVIATALLVAAVTFLVATNWLAGLRHEPAQPVGKTAERSPEEIEEGWTEQDLREAEPLPWPTAPASGPSLEGVMFVGALLGPVC